MLETHTIDFGKPIPVFPLPRCVLLPHTTIPIHIFEPRYRRMAHDALNSRGLIAMALFDGDGSNRVPDPCPPVREHVCIGYVIRHEALRDGRYNLLLQGVCRARIQAEVPSKPYRSALLAPTEGRPPLEIDLTDCRRRIENLLSDPLLKGLASVSAIHNWLNAEIPTAALVDLAAMAVCCDLDQRYAMLAEPDAIVRAARLEELLCNTRRTLALAERFRPSQPVDHVYLN